MEDYDIPGAEGLDLHHFYRAMAWLGEELEEKPAGALAPRCVKDLIEEKLFDLRRDLFTDLSMPVDGFRYTKGEPRRFKRDDLERAVTREFCSDCGTQLITRRPGLNAIVLKAGTLDDPTQYGACQMAINASNRQPFNCIQEGLPIYEGLPPR